MENEIKCQVHFLHNLQGWFLCLLAVLLPLSGFSQGTVIKQGAVIKTYYDEGHSLLKEMYNVKDLQSRILEGGYQSFYLDGKTKIRGFYINNKPDGSWTYFYENGNIKMRGNMKAGFSTGLWKYYFENGEISMQGDLKKGVREGAWKFYYESGLIKSEGPFKAGEKSGIWNYYYEDGTLKAQAFYNGKLGLYKEFYTSGNVKMKGYQLEGKSDSLWTYYYENGKVQAEGPYSGGLKQGHWILYDKNGIKTSEGNYDQGIKEGKWTYYYDNGNISSEGEEKDGKKDGYWKLYNPDGKFLGDGTFESGSGTYKEYYPNGHLKVTGNVVDDKNEGKWVYYYEDGTLEGVCNFVHGEGEYTGYYPTGIVKMKGTIKDSKNVGDWKLFAPDGTLTGYYHPVYENDKPVFKVLDQKPAEDTTAHDYIKPEYYYNNKKNRHFTAVINEYRGFILATNPVGTVIGKLPLSIEYYCQERLGHELQFSIIRSPFFGSHNSVDLNTLYQRGFDVAFRQKLYNRDKGFGMFYIANELRYTYLEHSFNALDSTELPAVRTSKISANEYRYEYSLIIGNRWMQLFSQWMVREKKQNGITLDIFAGMGIGYRQFEKKYSGNINYDKVFSDLHQGKISFSPRFGINLGYVF